jgi:hypothetical protein
MSVVITSLSMPAPFTKNWDCRAGAFFDDWALVLSFLLLPRDVMMTMVSRLKRRGNKVGLGKPTGGRRGWQNTSA